jgi:hypothetical protein
MKYGFAKTGTRLPRRQRGAFTMFTAVLILILLTEMIIYAVQVGVFEQRKSSNEMRQKEAFHLADSAIQFGKEFMLANSGAIPSSEAGGWLEAGSPRWQQCSAAGLTEEKGEHPCYAEPADNDQDFLSDLRNNMYYYAPDDAGLLGDPDRFGNPTLPIDVAGVLADGTQGVSVFALLCMLDIDRDADPIIQGCTTDPDTQDARYYMITLLARGEADCDPDSDPPTCTARALVVDKIGSFGPGGGEGGPNVPLTSRSTFPPTGTAELVPNPNGGGVGVPISAWLNNNDECPNQPPVDPSGGSWGTCERHEWYGTDIMPDDYKCPTANCSCSSQEKRISYAEQGDQKIGIDIVADDDFPCDLWDYMFGVPKYEPDLTTINDESVDFVKYGLAQEVLTDCDSLDENSSGVYWVSGSTCSVSANTQVGSAEHPVFLISAADLTRFNGGASLFGTLMITDVEDPDAAFHAVGTMTIYGAAVIDGAMGQYNGTFQVVYLENILEQSLETGAFGDVSGAWSDFHADWR